MLQRDYLMKLLNDFAQAIVRTLEREKVNLDPEEAALSLEDAIGQAVDMDGVALLSLAPESFASILEVSDTDPRVIEYIARSLLLGSEYMAEAGNQAIANLRREQALALADTYELDLGDVETIDFGDLEAMEENICQFVEKSLSE